MSAQRQAKITGLSSKMRAIQLRHRALDEMIAMEHKSAYPNSLFLQTWKREKLRLKDELTRYEGLFRTLDRSAA